MKRLLLACALLAPLALFASQNGAQALKGDAAQGATSAASCSACHGLGGNGASNPEWPKLAGQHAQYVTAQLNGFKCSSLSAEEQKASKCAPRNAPVMMAQASALSAQDMANISAYYAEQKPVPGLASKESLAIGNALYRGGDAKRGLAACSACHGPKGAGNPLAHYPRIGGQNAPYTMTQLKNYRSGERGAGKHAQMMVAVASKLTDAEISALASYVAGLQ